MSTEQGWRAIARRDLDAAQRAFEQAIARDPQQVSALIGSARVSILRGQIDRAHQLARQAMNLSNGSAVSVLMAELTGARGKRAEATSMLRPIVERDPRNAFARALLGEQRLRQGYWEDGTNLFIQAINQDRDGLAMAHMREIAWDMTEAVAAGKIRPQEALKFINQIDYSTPNDSSPFFATVRRALNKREALPRQTQSGGEAPEPQRAPERSSPAPPSPPQPPAPSSPQRPQSQQQQRPSRPQHQREPSPDQTNRTQRHGPGREMFGGGVQAIESRHQAEFRRAMRQDRELNEALQDQLGEFGSPIWPSQFETRIDDVDALEFEGLTVTEQLALYKKDPFRVTHGSILSQIYLERCLRSMLQQLPDQMAGAIAIYPPEISQIELNTLDGLFDEFPDVTTVDLGDEDREFPPPKLAAMGTFIGESIVRTYGASWSFDLEEPDESFIYIGNEELRPFETVRSWLESDTFDAVDLHAPVWHSQDALPRRRLSTIGYEYIDLTVGLEGEMLALKLAELWSFYRLKLTRVPPPKIAQDLEVLDARDDAFVIALGERWCPQLPGDHARRARRPNPGGYVLVHLRDTGEFLLLGHRHNAARAMEYLIGELNAKTAEAALRALATYHCPGATVVRSEGAARKLAQAHGDDAISKPHLERQRDRTSLIFWEVFERRPRRWALHYRPTYTMSWELTSM